MKVAVISDIHDRTDKLDKALEVISSCNIHTIICCGDIASVKTLEVLVATGKTIFCCLGNAEREPEEMFYAQNEHKNLTVFKEVGEIKLAGKTIGLTHYPHRAQNMAESGAFDFVFYGHNHTPWAKKIGDTVLLNPGEIAAFYGPQSTFALVNLKTGNYELKILA
ncbi:MAG: Phosphodiesterase, MJ0936 family [candidate division CPR2 bacterium GW2011_GWC1_39_9]|uniref:Phosphoesterase n=1 Tax=candidate division CPR2 bacterium GW2011_GWC2_39_10 TaxID=1618345 RepID=A0A0G0LYF0_UNCC2|nr:MAG: Phosphodiesterase, MJ0936 family [candidate division CPR2 bacterium GW2011_GWC2_39_10]KKR35939.1 MAG: Phosphodiesterase, MJ0936 family [candidate division CPR2 bacterium GW2011_GWC1_39_9]